jgi:hypothetical protein
VTAAAERADAGGAERGGAPEGSVVEGLRTLEVRWILPGPLAGAVTGWFGRFPAEMVAREDAYLLEPHLYGLSAKIRAGRALEVKLYHGGAGLLELPGRARGRLQSWQKWSFPVGPVSLVSLVSHVSPEGIPAGWTVVRKNRRISRFRLAGGQVVVGGSGLADEPGCMAELTEVHAGGGTWWSLGLEATGPTALLRSALEGTAALMFDRALPGGTELGLSSCRSYPEWLSRRYYP